jgi:hypothetical protein
MVYVKGMGVKAVEDLARKQENRKAHLLKSRLRRAS